jgi:serine/threonine-protein kinase
VAVKILVGGRVGDPSTLRRFEREGRAMARLEHPGIVAVHDFGRIGEGGAYLAMELLEGRTLREVIDAGRSAPRVVAVWFAAIFDAVAAAHKAGVVHRDLKPENVFITRRGVVKVLDFGLARFLQPGEHSSVTVPGLLIGTLGYIAPEQFLGKEADGQSDVFSLAVMIFEALTGQPPFPGRTIAELATSVFVDEPHLPGGTPEARALDRALGRCLVSDRRKRVASVAEMARVVLPPLEACPAIGDEAPTATPRKASS